MMASFQAKTSWERSRKSENKNYRFDQFLPRSVIQNSKEITKKFKKLKNIIMTSFLAKTGWEMLRKSENKNYHSNQFLLDP